MNKNIELALKHYSTAIELNPFEVSVRCNRARLYLNLDRYKDAIEDLTQAIVAHPTHEGAYILRAQCYEKLGKPELAGSDLNQVIELNPTSEAAYMSRGQFLMNQGRLQEAETDFRKVTGLNPLNPGGFFFVASLQIARKAWEEALPVLDKCLTLDPNFTHALFQRSTVHRELGKPDLAAEDVGRLIDLDPSFGLDAAPERG